MGKRRLLRVKAAGLSAAEDAALSSKSASGGVASGGGIAKKKVRFDGVSGLGGIGKATIVSRGKRKRAEQRARVGKKNAFIEAELARLEEEASKRRATASAQREQEKRSKGINLALSKMSALSDALVDLVDDDAQDASSDPEGKDAAKTQPAQKVLHAKARRKLVTAESAHTENVLQHPAFKADPMDALRQHLLSTVGEDPTEVPGALQEGKGTRRKRKQQAKSKANDVSARTSRAKGRAFNSETSAARKMEKASHAEKAKRRNRSGIAKPNGDRPSLGRIGEKRPKI